jgi:hypothetical protein
MSIDPIEYAAAVSCLQSIDAYHNDDDQAQNIRKAWEETPFQMAEALGKIIHFF